MNIKKAKLVSVRSPILPLITGIVLVYPEIFKNVFNKSYQPQKDFFVAVKKMEIYFGLLCLRNRFHLFRENREIA